jgi:YesN/AraC family two-component response regulator
MVYRVVVADDEADFRGWLRSLMEVSEDFELVGEACSGSEAVRMIPRLEPDLVIADMYMPEPDGLELARYVQDNYPHTKAILVSAQQDRVYERLATEEGALAFIPKTKVSLAALRQALQGEG